jgi:hypothetical protein
MKIARSLVLSAVVTCLVAAPVFADVVAIHKYDYLGVNTSDAYIVRADTIIPGLRSYSTPSNYPYIRNFHHIRITSSTSDSRWHEVGIQEWANYGYGNGLTYADFYEQWLAGSGSPVYRTIRTGMEYSHGSACNLQIQRFSDGTSLATIYINGTAYQNPGNYTVSAGLNYFRKYEAGIRATAGSNSAALSFYNAMWSASSNGAWYWFPNSQPNDYVYPTTNSDPTFGNYGTTSGLIGGGGSSTCQVHQ